MQKREENLLEQRIVAALADAPIERREPVAQVVRAEREQRFDRAAGGLAEVDLRPFELPGVAAVGDDHLSRRSASIPARLVLDRRSLLGDPRAGVRTHRRRAFTGSQASLDDEQGSSEHDDGDDWKDQTRKGPSARAQAPETEGKGAHRSKKLQQTEASQNVESGVDAL